MTAQEMWKAFSARENIDRKYEAWSFGDSPDQLAQLVREGTKTATASLHLWYELEKEPLPQAGEYSVILDSADEAVCVIRTETVFVVPFCQVEDRQAWKEGEGDRSLAYWRKVHEDFFSKELKTAGMTFHENMNVVCEEFICLYP